MGTKIADYTLKGIGSKMNQYLFHLSHKQQITVNTKLTRNLFTL